ncbi:MAG: nucleotidyltransferase domain-containing protein [Lachnospiraceae bacterium]|nr:nucleotidyltransferase domain-containing protein [Lachnospiraceae bacterium]
MIQDNELKNILEKLSASIKVVYGSKLKAIILYGSVARGTATPESDIDIMVLVDSSAEELKKYADKLCDVSTDFALEYFKVFSIIDVCYAEFSEWKQVLPFYRNVENEGVVLYAA